MKIQLQQESRTYLTSTLRQKKETSFVRKDSKCTVAQLQHNSISNNTNQTMSNKRNFVSVRAGAAEIIDLDYATECLFFAASPSTLCGELNVNDANSPGGKRTTRIYSLNTVDMTGKNTVHEYWGPHAEKAERYFM